MAEKEEKERNCEVDTTDDLDDLSSSVVIPDPDPVLPVPPLNSEESYVLPISPQKNVSVVRRRKTSSSGADTLVLLQPDGLPLSNLQQVEDGVIHSNTSLEVFWETTFQDQDDEKDDNEIDATGVTNSEPLSNDTSIPIWSLKPIESTIDPEAVLFSTDDHDHCEEAPCVTGLSSQSQNAKPSLIAPLLIVKVNNNYLEWVFILMSIVLEILLVVLDQIACPQKPQYALTALVVSFVAIAVSAIDLSFKARKQEVILRRQGMRFWFQYPSPSHKPFYTFIDIFGFICALSQFIFSTVAYSYHSRHADNPINISIVSFLFIICLASSKLTKDTKETPVSATV